MKHYILIITDSNRSKLDIKLGCGGAADYEKDLWALPKEGKRVVYLETLESMSAAVSRHTDIESYTRMQVERLIRKANPNWSNILKPVGRKEPIATLRSAAARSTYQPGAKFRPNVPNLISSR